MEPGRLTTDPAIRGAKIDSRRFAGAHSGCNPLEKRGFDAIRVRVHAAGSKSGFRDKA